MVCARLDGVAREQWTAVDFLSVQISCSCQTNYTSRGTEGDGREEIDSVTQYCLYRAHHEIRDQSFVEMHADMRPQATQSVALVLTNVAHECLDAIMVVQMFLDGRCAGADGPANWTLPAVGR